MAIQGADGKTLEEGVLTIATGNPAYYPWCSTMRRKAVKALKRLSPMPWPQMGFEADAVKWVRTSFDEAIQPGAKDFDFNMQQYSITPNAR